MKLLNKYNRLNIAATVLIMLITGVIYYFTISHILTGQIEKDLVLEENEIFAFVRLNNELPHVYESNHQHISFRLLGPGKPKRRFLDTTYKTLHGNNIEAARALISSVRLQRKNYEISVLQSTVETEDLIQIIFLITIGVIVALLAVLLLLNRLILTHMWRPFYKLLTQLKKFNLRDDVAVRRIPSEIDEFNELDLEVSAMASRVKTDYQNLKAFTENAAHELMTPIAVMNSKLDTLLQTDQLTEPQSRLLNDLYINVARLTRLNNSMLLLSKIENGLMKDKEEIDVKAILKGCLDLHEDFIQRKQLSLRTDLHSVKLLASKPLWEVLLNNLVGNAIKHTQINGSINLSLTNRTFVISNTGNKALDFNQALKRFSKSDESEGTGLGLTLCKQVCDSFGYTLEYVYASNMHNFSVTF
jgi:signal transduction histidine kinase